MRTDNGVGVNNQIVYWLEDFGQLGFTNSPYIPSTVPASQYSNYQNLYAEVLGLVSQTQVTYARAGNNLALQPIGSPAYNQRIIPYYNLYFSDLENEANLHADLRYGLCAGDAALRNQWETGQHR